MSFLASVMKKLQRPHHIGIYSKHLYLFLLRHFRIAMVPLFRFSKCLRRLVVSLSTTRQAGFEDLIPNSEFA